MLPNEVRVRPTPARLVFSQVAALARVGLGQSGEGSGSDSAPKWLPCDAPKAAHLYGREPQPTRRPAAMPGWCRCGSSCCRRHSTRAAGRRCQPHPRGRPRRLPIREAARWPAAAPRSRPASSSAPDSQALQSIISETINQATGSNHSSASRGVGAVLPQVVLPGGRADR